MEGVILFADDHIYSADRPERALYESFRSELPTLGVHSLELASQSIKSIGSFKALILDWQYSSDDSFEDIAEELGEKISIAVAQKEDAAYKFLSENNFYSLIYIFSEIDIEEKHGPSLKEKFGERIKFRKKDENFKPENIQQIRDAILEDIKNWGDQNKNLSIPIQWSASINRALQNLFKRLAEADKDWIKEIHNSAKTDGVDPELFVIELLQLQLTESLVQDEQLISTLKAEGEIEIQQNDSDDKKKSLAKLFSILHFSELKDDAPLMTGDICRLDENVFGVIITPECDIKKIKDNSNLYFDLLKFQINSFEEAVRLDHIKKNKKAIFSQVIQTLHFLPSFPAFSGDLRKGIVIDFTSDSIKVKSDELLSIIAQYPRKFKLNSPFIQQLRQRYLSHLGRVGTPAIHPSVREWNLGV